MYVLLALPVAIWIMFRFLLLPPGPFLMDQGEHKGSGSFFVVMWSAWFGLIFVSSMICAFIFYMGSLNMAAESAVVAAVESLIFIGALVYFYECYLHGMANDRVSNYSSTRYSTLFALGVSSLASFVLSLVMAGLQTVNK